MSQQPHQQPWGTPPQQPQAWGAPMPQPPKKGKGKKIALGIVGGFVGIIVIAAVASGGSDSTDDSKANDKPAAAAQKPAEKPAEAEKADAKPADKPVKKPVDKGSQADQFKAFVTKNGTPAEKTAVAHVTKVQGADERNDIMDSADVYTDWSGGIMSPNQGKAKILASAFADWKDSDNGLVTVYDKDGELMANGNF
ncbi:hypothetical protein [Streptomyces sp. SCSIO ZS0520]|uniref:hypothetical protein n=1 Tax=Streptomyces sp. SCSIO ZS0520 TaxID=2892996 RepID=UPI0021D869D0|nr:hypothetical protein [Streptomyces sp. SCSIO ZS0520]